MTYHGRVIEGGKVVVPAKLRRELGLKTGDPVVFARDGESVVIKTYAQVVRETQQKFREMITEPFTLDEFLAERHAEAARE